MSTELEVCRRCKKLEENCSCDKKCQKCKGRGVINIGMPNARKCPKCFGGGRR